MKNNLKGKPNLEWIINQPRTKERIDDAYATIVDMKHWIEDFEKELRQLQKESKDALKTAKNPVRIGWNWQFGLLNEILGDSE